MPVLRTDIRGSVNIGNYAKTVGRRLLLTGEALGKNAEKFDEILGVPHITVRLSDSHLTSPFFAGNGAGILASRFVEEDTVEEIRSASDSQRVDFLDTKLTAIGNLILANDTGAIVSPIFTKRQIRAVSDILDIETEKGTLADAPYVGSLGCVNNHGGIVTPYASDKEIQRVEDLLKIEVHRGTVNSGVPFISSGLVASDTGALAGKLTDGKELMGVTKALQVL